MRFEHRHCIVTGGTGALGRGVVDALLNEGAICHVPYHQAEPDWLGSRGHPRLKFRHCDMSDEGSVADFFNSAPELWASIHLVGNFNSGPISKLSKADLASLIDTNLVTCVLACREAVNRMAQGGRIVNVAARPALEWRQGKGMAAYAAAKAAVAAFTVALAEEVAEAGVLVNAVAPSIMDTPANRKAMPSAHHARWPKVEDVAATICFLASPDNTVTRGAVVPVYGAA